MISLKLSVCFGVEPKAFVLNYVHIITERIAAEWKERKKSVVRLEL